MIGIRYNEYFSNQHKENIGSYSTKLDAHVVPRKVDIVEITKTSINSAMNTYFIFTFYYSTPQPIIYKLPPLPLHQL